MQASKKGFSFRLPALFGRQTPRKKVYPLSSHAVRSELIDPGVLDIIRHLKKRGFDGYLVGGCVRDLLLKTSPKDFDVVTDAKPRQVKNSFRNCRLIGRRFRLAHVYIGRDRIVEVSTYRGTTDEELPEDDRFAANNVWGTMETDAVRRDFTVNALYYDPANGSIIDHVGGVKDIKSRILRSIKDPEISFPEDPVRIVRAARFSAMLGLEFSREDLKAAKKHAVLLGKTNAGRMLEELKKILKCGSSSGVFSRLQDLGVLAHWFPELSRPDVFEPMLKRLAVLDAAVKKSGAPSEQVQFTSLFYDLFKTATGPEGTRGYQDAFVLLRQTFRDMVIRCQLPRWLWFGICEIAANQQALCRKYEGRRMMRYVRHVVQSPHYAESKQFLEMDHALTGRHAVTLEFWKDIETKARQPLPPPRPHQGNLHRPHAHPSMNSTGNASPPEQPSRTPAEQGPVEDPGSDGTN
jgi:poly(A) polymerase